MSERMEPVCPHGVYPAHQCTNSRCRLEADLATVTAERDGFRAMWSRDSTALSVAIGQRDTARAVAEDNRARYVTAERERDQLREALRELRSLAGAYASDDGVWPPLLARVDAILAGGRVT
jgi:hypothetical protein